MNLPRRKGIVQINVTMSSTTSPFRSAHTALLAFGILFFSTACQKDDAEPAAPSVPSGQGAANTTASTTPSFTGAAAVLAAVSTASTQTVPGFGDVAVDINTGAGYFQNEAGVGVQVGGVSLNSTPLSFINGAYTFMPGATNPFGIDFSSGVTWNVAAGNGFSAFNRNATSITFPTAGSITSGAAVDRSAGYTLTTDFVNNADSVYFIIGNVLLRRGANAGSCTFPAGDLAALGAGPSLAMVAAFNYYSETIDGKLVYFVKERVLSRSVTVQ